jgi:hypothetical protein
VYADWLAEPRTPGKEWKMYRVPLTCLLAMLAASASAQNGLNFALETGLGASERSPRLGAGDLRLNLSVDETGTALARARLLGDYYLTGPGFGDSQVSGGLRVTSGLAVGPRDGTSALPPLRLEGGLQWGPREADPSLVGQGGRVTLPYIGLGYTTLSAREGWGLSADIGLGGQRPGERVRFGAGNPTAAQFENVLNDLRLEPVIQLGVSYAF